MKPNKSTLYDITWALRSGIICLLQAGILSFTHGQLDMDKGYHMLDNQQYEEAEEFFSSVLESEPFNKTAQICLGRAMGLGGNTTTALSLFKKLETDFPGDKEVLYNIAEAYLWNNVPAEALAVYNQIIEMDQGAPNAALGKANALSSLKKYEEAVLEIDRALALSPDNNQAKVSRKFIYLARADELRKLERSGESHTLINEVLSAFPGDEQALFDQATTFLYQQKYFKAKAVYEDLRKVTSQKVRLMSSLSYVNLLLSDKKRFLSYADSALYYNDQPGDESIPLVLNKSRALVFNNKERLAFSLLDSLSARYPGNSDVEMTHGQLALWSGKKGEALAQFKDLAGQEEVTYEIWMGLAESYKANERKRQALTIAEKAWALQPINPDAKRMVLGLRQELRPMLNASFLTSSDKGGNSATELAISAESRIASSLWSKVRFMRRNTENENTKSSLNIDQLSWDSRWFANGAFSLSSALGYAKIQELEGDYSTRLNGGFGIHLKPGKVHSLDINYETSFLDYNPALLQEQIRTDHYKLIYHAYTSMQLGSYNQLIWTRQSDGNERWLYFGSLYYNLFTYPVIQLALNYNTFSYQLKRPDTYFSPDRFHSVELMGKVDNEVIKGSRWRYLATLASGYQFINNNSAQWTVRTEVKLKYALSERLTASLQYLYSNAAQSTAAGFTFNQVGVSLFAIL